MFIEYPKMLFLDGDPSKQWLLAYTAEQEDLIRADGYRVVGEPAPQDAPKRRGRPRKESSEG